uniref:DUF2029 domain-containing protein n=1 Tax=Thermosporothrix sp. COM3 TaxID=2490863 RepID=A0A455SKY7_9CHLR|nr:hypothetical protein KTC_15860 [Thermosporothrix sp. COM3]
MKDFFKSIKTYKLIYLGLIIHMLYYISAFHTGWFNGLFTGSAIHYCCKGLDFYQVPDGAYAYWHNGKLTGEELPDGTRFSQDHPANKNVYHPLFTLIVGTILLPFSPEHAFTAWLMLKLALTIGVVCYFIWIFQNSKYISFAVFVLLAFATNYLEIAIAQFHSVLNAFLLLFLIDLVKRKSVVSSSILSCLTMLVKPIVFLWTPLLIIKKRSGIALGGLLLFALYTGIFTLDGAANYYIDNLRGQLLAASVFGPDQIITLGALIRFDTNLPDVVYQFIRYGTLAGILVLSLRKRFHIVKGCFLLTVYYLFFYSLVFEYHYTSLAPVIAICLVCCPEFQTLRSRICVLLTCLPSAFVFLNILNIGTKHDSFYGTSVDLLGWRIMVISKVLPVLFLCIFVLSDDVIALWKRIRKYIQQWRRHVQPVPSHADPAPAFSTHQEHTGIESRTAL